MLHDKLVVHLVFNLSHNANMDPSKYILKHQDFIVLYLMKDSIRQECVN